MKPAHLALVIIGVLLITPIGYLWGSAARARLRRDNPRRLVGRTEFGPTSLLSSVLDPADLAAIGAANPVVNPTAPTGFALVPQGVVYQTTRPEPAFTDSRGLSVHRVEIPDRAPFLVSHDPTHCGATPPRCWHRSPDLPAWGGWGDWLIELDQIRTTGHALAELTLTDHRALEAFLEYGRTQRATQMGAN